MKVNKIKNGFITLFIMFNNPSYHDMYILPVMENRACHENLTNKKSTIICYITDNTLPEL